MSDASESAGERITDARRIRALSHPLRLELLDLLAEGELTATQCAEFTGDSVASCSFHLRTLAKYGYISPGERRGREKPWHLVSRSRDIRPDFDDPASVRAAGEMARFAVEHAFEHVRAWLDVVQDEDPAWAEATTIFTAGTWVTREELAELSRTIQGLTDRFAGRTEDPGQRPSDARPIRVLGVTTVDSDWEAREQHTGRAR